jgi:hypothetical protein
MTQEFGGDLAGAEFWGADLTGATFRDVNLTGVTISHAWLVDVAVDALVERVVINGVDVTAYVNERDPWYPLRALIRTTDPDSMRAAWKALDDEWANTLVIARDLPEAALHESVAGEWSFVQTLRHLVFASDKWFTAPILGERFHSLGMPNAGSHAFPWPDIDAETEPSIVDVLNVRRDMATRLRNFLVDVTADDLTRSVDVLENGEHTLQQCIDTVFEEEFWHLRYARRDLAVLASAS